MRYWLPSKILAMFFALATIAFGADKPKPRARDLGIPFSGTPGKFNAITDVRGVEVGHTTLISDGGKVLPGVPTVRTGVTAVLPNGKHCDTPIFAGWSSLNGNGEMTGTTWIEEGGFLEGPVMITNTLSVGTVRDAVIKWGLRQIHGPGPKKFGEDWGGLPVVAETDDSDLNDIRGFHVKEKNVFRALDSAASGFVAEGNVGGGTGMICYDFKGGIGTASRTIQDPGPYTIGVLVQANQGERKHLMIAGVPVGREMPEKLTNKGGKGSIIIIVATDAPLLPHQLKRLARRAASGLARTGTISHDGSGEIFLSFSVANGGAYQAQGHAGVLMVTNDKMNPLFEATVEAVEEAIINALIAAETMTGINGRTVAAIPHHELREILKKYNRLQEGGVKH